MITVISKLILIILLIVSYIQAKSPSIVSFPSGGIECFAGESLTLKCRAEGSKPITYTWFRNGLEIGQKDLIKLNSLSLIDQGDYICIARNEFGADTGLVYRVIIRPGVKASFSVKPIKGPAPLSVHFTNLSKGMVSESVWDFGDSSFSMENNPVHVYQKAGVYSVTLKVRKARQSDSTIQNEIIKVLPSINQTRRDSRQKRDKRTNKSREDVKEIVSFPSPLFFKGLYLGADSTKIAFNNMHSEGIDTLILWYGLKPIPLFSDKRHVKKIDPAFFWTESPDDSIILTLKDTLFAQKADSGYCALIMVSKKHITSDTFMTAFQLSNGNQFPFLHEGYIETKLPVRITNGNIDDETHLLNISWESFVKKAASISIFCSPDKKVDYPKSFLFTKKLTGKLDSLEFNFDIYLPYDTLYELSLWISDSSGNMFIPDNYGRMSFQINRPQWRSFFLSDSQAVPFFNNSVLLRKKSGDSLTGKIYLESAKTIPGMICAGNVIGISVQNNMAGLEAGLPLRNFYGKNSCISNLYHQHGQNCLFVFKDHVDSSTGTIWTNIGINEDTLIYPLIDTIPPKITILSDTGSIAAPGSFISDTIIVSDNISNCRWEYITCDAASSEISVDTGCLSSAVDTLIFRVPVKKDSLNCLWIRFVVNDGTWSDTVNLSRRIFRFGGELPVKKMNWTPVISTAFRRFSSAESVFTRLCPESKWKYDPYKFRLFRLTVSPSNKSNENYWTEYSDQNSRLFTVEPGRVIWLKSGIDGAIRFGAGFSTPLKDSFSIVLQPKSWNDFALPYQHPLKLNQILKSTGQDSDSLEFFIWSEGKLGTSYYLSPFFIKGLTSEYNTRLFPQKPYSVYNPLDRRIIMKIPAESFFYDTCTTNSNKSDGWILRLIAFDKDGESFDEAWCGMGSDISEDHLYISPASLSKIKMSFVGENGYSTGGYLLCPINSNGRNFHLRISNGSEITESISLNKDIIGAFPDSFDIKLFLASGKIFEDSCLKIDPGHKEDIWIAAGAKEYIADFKDSIETIKPEISSLFISNDSVYVKIQYPFSGIENVIVSISDNQNKVIWHQTFQSIPGGIHTFFWDGTTDRYTRAPAGFYILNITGCTTTGNKNIEISKIFLYFRNKDNDS